MERARVRHIKFKAPAKAPVIEFDHSVRAWYIRFKNAKVAKTITEDVPGCFYSVDLDEKNEVIGLELIGVSAFTIKRARQLPVIDMSRVDFESAKFVPAQDLVEA